MKNYFKYISLVALLFAAFSCSDDDGGKWGESPEFGWVQFNGSNPNTLIFIEDIIADETANITLPFSFTAPINLSPLTVNYNVVNIEGVASDVISFSGSSVVAANTNTGVIVLDIDLSALEANPFQNYIFDVVLTSASRGVRIGLQDGSYPTSFRVNLSAPCEPPTIGGLYSVTTEYGYHDFLPNFNPHTMEVEIVDNGDGTYFIQDFSGGLYTVGPYAAAYGTGPNSIDVTFFTVCDDILWEDQNDPWGPVVPQDDGVNSVDPDTGVITISWFCNGYGENGVSVYTPL